MPGSPVRLLITIAFLCSFIYTIHYNASYILIVHANQTSELPAVKITSHVQNQQVQTGRLSITGVSTDDSTTDCDVYIILNEIKPYQRVNPTGKNNTTEEDHDYSTWNHTFTPEYATILEGNNRMVSKITCIDHFSINNENLTKFNSLNVTGMGIIDNAIDSEPEIQARELPTNATYSALVQLQDPDSTNTNLDNEISNPNHLQNTKSQNDKQDDDDDDDDDDKVSNEKEDKKNDSDSNGADYSSSSRNEDEEGEDFKDFIEQLHDRVSGQVKEQLREQLRESGIDLPG
jgi:hypothetical protein